MLAVTAARFSDDDPLSGLELGERPSPLPPPGWEVVHVRAAGLNHHDLWTLRGVGVPPERLPIVLGCDAAGVTSDGREVVVHAVVEEEDGDASILSERYDGTHAEVVVVPSANLVDKPPELSFAEAACLPTAWLTAYRMLFVQGGLRPGQRVLVQGAGGGVATAAIALARAAGMKTYATSRSEDKRRQALDLGAHEVFESGARLPERVDGVVETVGAATWAHSLRCLDPGGVVVVAGATTGADPPADLRRVFYRQLRVVGSTMGTRAELVDLLRMLSATGVRPAIDTTMPLADAAAAYARMAAGDVFGKLVLTPG
ncbi:zinc-binding dehydrogenase [soil metagenome]|jgi:NADPH:quinone reductase-like Zn-dependent oxidoreductase|nr:zinc-binding dehydrogenase [Euzebyaceae bacterium]